MILKKLAEGEDYQVWTTTDNGLMLTCRKCSWEINLDLLDTLEDIQVELEHHGDINHGTKVN